MMNDEQKRQFIADVVSAAEQVDYEDMLLSSRSAQDFGGPPIVDEQSREARTQAEALSKNAVVLQHLCPALKTASSDLQSIAKVAGTALLTLAFTPTAPVSLSTLAIGALAVMIARAGVAALCPDCAPKAQEGD